MRNFQFCSAQRASLKVSCDPQLKSTRHGCRERLRDTCSRLAFATDCGDEPYRDSLASLQLRGVYPCAFQDVKRSCALRCRGADFSRAPPRLPLPRRRSAPEPAVAQELTLPERDRSDPHHVAGISDLLRRARHRDAAAVRFQEGRLQSLLVADRGTCRHPSRCADPFLGEGHDRRPDRGLLAGRSAGGGRCHRAGGQECRLSDDACRSRILREEARPHSRQCLRRHEFGLGALRRRRGEIHRQGCSGHFPFSGRFAGCRANGC